MNADKNPIIAWPALSGESQFPANTQHSPIFVQYDSIHCCDAFRLGDIEDAAHQFAAQSLAMQHVADYNGELRAFGVAFANEPHHSQPKRSVEKVREKRPPDARFRFSCANQRNVPGVKKDVE